MRTATLDLGSLSRDYDGGRTPADVVGEVYARIAARGEDHVWIHLRPESEVVADAEALDPADRSRLPLWGVPYALKDNIDAEGLPTTAACPAFAHVPQESAALVARLRGAGALLVGKTNLDQFATGLNGTRSPYGAPTSVSDPTLISGGSSSGSAVAVAAGLVPFAIGTDTAGSGRVPAALNGVVGLKPSIGLVSSRGVVPACASLDCASVFATCVDDAARVLHVIAGHDTRDHRSRAWSVPAPRVAPAPLTGARLAVPTGLDENGDWGTRGERASWEHSLQLLVAAGAELVPVDPVDLWAAGDQLYGGAWVAERLEVAGQLLSERPEAVLPVIRDVLSPGRSVTGAEVFSALDELARLRLRTHRLLDGVSALLTPTVTTTFTFAEMAADPVGANARLGRWTTFTNLLDLCAVSVPAPATGSAPFGVTVQLVAGHDARALQLAAGLEVALGCAPTTDIAVAGAHLEGQPLHHQLIERGAVLVSRTTTSPSYRLTVLPGSVPAKPGLRRVAAGGAGVEVEVYRLPRTEVGQFLAQVSHPLALGQLELADGRWVTGFVCEPVALEHAEDITRYGGWRGWLARAGG